MTNASIVLAGQPVNILDEVREGERYAFEQQKRDRERKIQELYKTQGAGIAAGEESALNALAAYSPEAALGIQEARQSMDLRGQENARADARLGMDRERLAMSREEMDFRREQARRQGQMEMAQFRERASAAQAKAAAEKLETAGNALAVAEGQTQWASVVRRHGLDPAEYRWEDREIVLAEILGATEFMKMEGGGDETPAAFRTLEARAQAAGLEPGTPEFQQFMLSGGKNDGLAIDVGEDGGISVRQGAGAGTSAPKLTVDAARNTGFLVRAQESNQILNELEEQGLRFAQQNTDAIPMGLGNFLRDSDFQRFDQARRDFVNATLRQESGAVISDQEFANAERQYFPQPGDSPEVIAQKRRNRETKIEGFRLGAGGGAGLVPPPEVAEPADISDDELIGKYLE